MATTEHPRNDTTGRFVDKDAAPRRKPAASRTADRPGAGVAVGAAAAGLVAGLAANFVRKAIVQAPTAVAGRWDEALAVEHRMVSAIFDKLEETDTRNTIKRATLLTQLKHALAKHALQEENVVYAELRDQARKDDADKLNHDHGYVKQYLYDLTNIPKDSPAWIVKVREFRQLIERHVREEEDEIFPALARALSDEENKQLTVAMNKEGLKIA